MVRPCPKIHFRLAMAKAEGIMTPIPIVTSEMARLMTKSLAGFSRRSFSRKIADIVNRLPGGRGRGSTSLCFSVWACLSLSCLHISL